MTFAVTILLVDEEPLLRRATALLLAERGGKVSAVATMGEAVALAQENVFDVTIIDVGPGGPSPAELLQQLREQGVMPGRLVVCACPPLPSREPPPFTAVIQKPYAFERLLAAVFSASRPARSGVFAAHPARTVAAHPRRSREIGLRGLRRALTARPGRASPRGAGRS